MIPGAVAVWFWVSSLLCRRLPEAIESLSVKHIVSVSLILLMVFFGAHERAEEDVEAIASFGFYRHESAAKPLGEYEYRDMYLVDEWHPALGAVLKD